MTLTINSNMNNHQSSNSDQDSNEKYRLLTLVLEKKIRKVTLENDRIAGR